MTAPSPFENMLIKKHEGDNKKHAAHETPSAVKSGFHATTIRLPQSDYAAIRILAFRQNITMLELMRRALQDYCRQYDVDLTAIDTQIKRKK